MTTLVVGASGATGKQLVEQLLNRGQHVKVIVRSPERVPKSWKNNKRLLMITASVLDLTDAQMSEYLKDCQAIASCLGHTISFKGFYGKPRRLVTDATRRLSMAVAVNKPEKRVRFVLMNTTANRNRDLNEAASFAQRAVFALIRLLLPPQPDNEQAANYLRTKIGQQNPYVEWVAVRPDGLIDEEETSEYEVYPSPIRSPIFNPGQTSRINVGHFMAELISNDEVWNKWKGRMPVIYNKTFEK